jgi:pimeloyl-ACP methyl ester carboxylesterase
VAWRQYTLIHRELELAVQEQGESGQTPILALHGWRDNSASFNRLAELLPQYHIIAPDFPGHGRSARRHAQGSYSIWSYLDEVDVLVERHCPQGGILLGHSMGGAVAALLCGAVSGTLQETRAARYHWSARNGAAGCACPDA